MLLLAVVVLLQIINFAPTEGQNIVWTDIPASASGIEGQSVNITLITDLREFPSGTTWSYVEVYYQPGGVGSKDRMIKLTAPSTKYVFSNYRSRAADLTLTVTKTGTVVTIVFTIDNLNKTTDGKEYRFRLETTAFGEDSLTGTLLNVLVPIVITSPNPHYITVNESDAAQLVCAATGNPEPKVNWTKHGVLVGTGMYTTDIVGIHDDKTCNYTCIAYNGKYGAKTAKVCLNVQFKPRGAVVVSDKTTVCQNDNVTLTCTSGPANPAPSSYEFYNNGVLVGTSATNVYVAIATAVLPSVNKFVCVPRNLLGSSLKNGSVKVIAKVKPVIVTPPKPTTVIVEGNVLTLFCNASALPTPKIMWINAVGSKVGSGETLTISNVARGHESTYRCIASNGDECNTASANGAVTVKYFQSEIERPIFKVTKDSLTVTWKKLPRSINADCRLSVTKLANGTTWVTASNTSQKILLSCTVNELLSDTTYIAKFILKLSQRHVNGSIYIVTAAQDHTEWKVDKQKGDSNETPYVVLGIVIAVSLLVIAVLTSYIIWIDKKGSNGKGSLCRDCQRAKKELASDIALRETRKPLSNIPTVSNSIPEYEDIIDAEKVQTTTTDTIIPEYEPVFNRKSLSRPAYANAGSIETQFNSPGHESSPCVTIDLQNNAKEMRSKGHQDETNVTETKPPVKYNNSNKFSRHPNEAPALSDQNAVGENDYQSLQISERSPHYQSLENVKSAYKL